MGDHRKVPWHVTHLNLHFQLPADVIERFIAGLLGGVGVVLLAVNNLAIESALADTFSPDDDTSLQVVVLFRFLHF